MTGGSNGNGGSRLGDLTDAVRTARRGFRSDVKVLVDSIDDGELFVPLAKTIEDAPLGEEIEVGEELSIVPQLLSSEEGQVFCALFTRPAMLDGLDDRLGWTTDDGDLQYCALPARLAIDVALSIVDDENVHGLVFNALDDTELMLQRTELASIAQGRPIPLVGYVQQIPIEDDEETLVAEPDEPPPQEVIDVLDRCTEEITDVKGYVIEQTFNAERDLEPHMTLKVRTKRRDADYAAIANRLMAELEGKVPPPGYVDIVFEIDEPN